MQEDDENLDELSESISKAYQDAVDELTSWTVSYLIRSPTNQLFSRSLVKLLTRSLTNIPSRYYSITCHYWHYTLHTTPSSSYPTMRLESRHTTPTMLIAYREDYIDLNFISGALEEQLFLRPHTTHDPLYFQSDLTLFMTFHRSLFSPYPQWR